MKYSVVIPAAGQGKRMNLSKNKQFLLLEDKPIIIHTLEIFQNDDWCEEIIVVANLYEVEEMRELIDKFTLTKVRKVVPGGNERQQSVHNGLKAVTGVKIVLIHDGARPFITINRIHELVVATTENEAAILAVPVKDTVKSCQEQMILHTIDRSNLWSAQTPQAFQLQTIIEAHQWAENNDFLGTDDASLLEQLHKKVTIVAGDYYNIKITTPEDIVFAQAILQVKRGKNS